VGELLVERGLITRQQLDWALARQQATKEFIGTILVREGLVTPEALLAALSERYRIPHEPLRVEAVDWAIAKQFPSSVLLEGRCFPIRGDEDSVTVAIANPLETWSLSAIEKAAGFRKVRAVLVLEQELREVVQAYQRQLARSIGSQLDSDGRA
jgi:hypothetical protein